MAATQQAGVGSPSGVRRRSRLGLYAPFIALAVLAIVWSVAWAVIRARTESGLDEWLAAEAGAGRFWTCPDRSIAGYPFRIEVRCAALTLDQGDARAALGPLLVVSQVYRPRHVIAEASGPLQVSAGSTRLSGAWRLLRLSVILSDRGFERASLSADDSTATVSAPGLDRLDLASRRLEAHVRPRDPSAAAYEVVGRLVGASIPGLDWLIGGTELADAEVELTATGSAALGARPLASELERWRQAGGKLDLTRLALGKGPRRVDARGSFGLDAEHRLEGELSASAAGLEGLLGRFVGERAGLGGAILGALLGRGSPAPAPNQAASALRPLPPIRLEGGRVYVGPLAVPGIRLPPLY